MSLCGTSGTSLEAPEARAGTTRKAGACSGLAGDTGHRGVTAPPPGTVPGSPERRARQKLLSQAEKPHTSFLPCSGHLTCVCGRVRVGLSRETGTQSQQNVCEISDLAESKPVPGMCCTAAGGPDPGPLPGLPRAMGEGRWLVSGCPGQLPLHASCLLFRAGLAWASAWCCEHRAPGLAAGMGRPGPCGAPGCVPGLHPLDASGTSRIVPINTDKGK